jgi:hypothetical protein
MVPIHKPPLEPIALGNAAGFGEVDPGGAAGGPDPRGGGGSGGFPVLPAFSDFGLLSSNPGGVPFACASARCTHLTVCLARDSLTVVTESVRIPNRAPGWMEPSAKCISSVAELCSGGGIACSFWLKLKPIH